jgi:hypothetical protein
MLTVRVPSSELGYSLAKVTAGMIASLQNTPSHPIAQLGAAQPQTAATPTTLTSDQLQALPLPGRNWENFVLDAQASESEGEEDAKLYGAESAQLQSRWMESAYGWLSVPQ